MSSSARGCKWGSSRLLLLLFSRKLEVAEEDELDEAEDDTLEEIEEEEEEAEEDEDSSNTFSFTLYLPEPPISLPLLLLLLLPTPTATILGLATTFIDGFGIGMLLKDTVLLRLLFSFSAAAPVAGLFGFGLEIEAEVPSVSLPTLPFDFRVPTAAK